MKEKPPNSNLEQFWFFHDFSQTSWRFGWFPMNIVEGRRISRERTRSTVSRNIFVFHFFLIKFLAGLCCWYQHLTKLKGTITHSPYRFMYLECTVHTFTLTGSCPPTQPHTVYILFYPFMFNILIANSFSFINTNVGPLQKSLIKSQSKSPYYLRADACMFIRIKHRKYMYSTYKHLHAD